MSSAPLTLDTGALIQKDASPNWTRDFPVVGQGTLVFSIERNTPFAVVIRPKLAPGQPGADQWISLEVHETWSNFKMRIGDKTELLEEVRGVVKGEKVGYVGGRKISYWFSYDRDLLALKYGKGYRMEQTTLMTHEFRRGDDSVDKAKRQALKYLFSPTIRRCVEQYDLEPKKEMVQRYAVLIQANGFHGRPLQEVFPHLSLHALSKESESLASSIVDIESQVSFDKEPFVCNWSPIVLDSSKINLFELEQNKYTFSASLPPACLELYSNVTAANVALDWSPEPTKYRLSDAIRHSLRGPHGKLHRKLASKRETFGEFNHTYLRVTLGSSRGSSPGVPYVLEIWPKNHRSPIHSHGNAYAVIRVLHGGITVKIFNKHENRANAPQLMKFDIKAGDTTWISPNWFQTHQLWNTTDDYCATIQCYKYGVDDLTHWPYFDYVTGTEETGEFSPNSDYTFSEMRDMVMEEFAELWT